MSDGESSGLAGYYYRCADESSYIWSDDNSGSISFECMDAGGAIASFYALDNIGNTSEVITFNYYLDTT